MRPEPNLDPVWINTRLVVAIHHRLIYMHGGIDEIRDGGLLESALTRAKDMLAYLEPRPDIAALGAAYGFGIARNHPFLDGNKRAAFVVCDTFFRLNNWDIAATQQEVYQTFLALAAGEVTEDELSLWIRDRLKGRPL